MTFKPDGTKVETPYIVRTNISTTANVRKEKPPASNDEELKIALFGGDEEITDEMWQEAKFAAQKIKERYNRFGEKKPK